MYPPGFSRVVARHDGAPIDTNVTTIRPFKT
jgi:hypothetical protein